MLAVNLPDSPPERRGALRHAVTVSALLSSTSGEAVSVTITDISEGGCQLARTLEIQPGTAIVLSFGGYAPVEAAVIWTSPAAFGLRFDASLHPALVAQVVSAGRGRRRARSLTSGLVRREEREKLWHLALPVRVTMPGDAAAHAHPLEGQLCDLSVEGCKVLLPVAVMPGVAVLISIAGGDPFPGSVRWCEDGRAGIRFSEAVSSTIIEKLAHLPFTG